MAKENSLMLGDVINDCIGIKLSGRATDSVIQCVGVNFLEKNKPVIAIEVESKENLLWMMNEAESSHVYIRNDIFYINALYGSTDSFPAARIYFIKSEDLLLVGNVGAYIERNGIKLSPVNDASFSKLIDDAGYAQRYEAWHAKWKANASIFDDLLEGRRENTAVDQGIWLSSDGRCLVCGVKTDRMATSTVLGKSGIMFGMQLCLTHEAESQKQSTLLNYLSKHLGGLTMFSDIRPWTAEEAIRKTCEILREKLDCTIVKVKGQTVTACRQSGVRVVIRQATLSNYAYNILSPEKKEISRVDSADHHKVPYGPDHVHFDLSKSKKRNVEASFTYGDVGLDVKLILKLIKEAEDKLSGRQGEGVR